MCKGYFMNKSISKNSLNKKKLHYSAHLALCTMLLASGSVLTQVARAQSVLAASRVSAPDAKPSVFELGNAFEAPGNVDKQKTRLIFYRPSSSSFKGVASVYYNGMYHATLARNTFTILCVSSGIANIGVKPVVLGLPVKAGIDSISSVELQDGKNQYIRVIEDRNIKMFQSVDEPVALAEMATSREQIHTLSRVSPVLICSSNADQRAAPSETTTTPQPPTQTTKPTFPIVPATAPSDDVRTTRANESVQIITFAANALFEFAGSNQQALGEKGNAALDYLIANVKANYSIVKRIQVQGFSDPIGTPQQNTRLARKRAQTVMEYLKKNGFESIPMTSAGLGSSALVITSCGRNANAQNILCNSPNRRVRVAISGIRR